MRMPELLSSGGVSSVHTLWSLECVVDEQCKACWKPRRLRLVLGCVIWTSVKFGLSHEPRYSPGRPEDEVDGSILVPIARSGDGRAEGPNQRLDLQHYPDERLYQCDVDVEVAFILTLISFVVRMAQHTPLLRGKTHRMSKALRGDVAIPWTVAVKAKRRERQCVGCVVCQVESALQTQVCLLRVFKTP